MCLYRERCIVIYIYIHVCIYIYIYIHQWRLAIRLKEEGIFGYGGSQSYGGWRLAIICVYEIMMVIYRYQLRLEIGNQGERS